MWLSAEDGYPRVSAARVDRIVGRRSAFALLVGVLFSLFWGGLAHAATFSVNSVGDTTDDDAGDGSCFTGLFNVPAKGGGFGPECTLRAAIQEANALAGADTVVFSSVLPTTAGVVEFFPSSGLPDVTDTITIDGYSHPDYDGSKPIIQLGGGNAGAVNGIFLGFAADSSVVRGLAIHSFAGHGIRATGPSDIVIEGCQIGIRRGVFYDGNGGHGILLDTASNASIGLRCDDQGCAGRLNVISANGESGIRVAESPSASIQGNRIGTDVSGSVTFISGGGSTPNALRGIHAAASDDVLIGSDLQSDGGNLISGNLGMGILVGDGSARIYSNRIGTNLAGTAALGNGGAGIYLNSGSQTRSFVGASGPVGGNLISGNGSSGIYADAKVEIAGNTVGLSLDQSSALGNDGNGIQIAGDSAVVRDNVVGDNALSGIRLDGDFGEVFDNLVGTTPDRGFHPNPEAITVNGIFNQIGKQNQGNIIAYGSFAGLSITSSANSAIVVGNWIGTDADGTPLGNQTGIRLFGATQNAEIGPLRRTAKGPGFENVIGHNTSHGVFFGGPSTGAVVRGNYIGTDQFGRDLGNGGAGVLARGTDNDIGAALDDPTPSDIGNVIAFNGGPGVSVGIGEFDLGIAIRANHFHSNGGLAVDLFDDGETPNDFGDVDTGPNRLQNFPEFDLAQTRFNEQTGELEVRYRVNTNEGDAAYPLLVDFYVTTETQSVVDAWIGQDSYPAMSATLFRSVSIPPDVLPFPNGLLVAMATDASGNSSEFSREEIPVPEPDAVWLSLAASSTLYAIALRHRTRSN